MEIRIEILKLLWPDVKHYHEMLNEVCNTRSLTESQSKYVQTINVLTKIQTTRINKYLPWITDADQGWFM